MDYIFISYSNVDRELALAICHILEENGMPCWIAPRDIAPGVSWPSAVIRAIRECKVMLLVYSEHSNKSQQVANEVDRAFSNNKPIIPFLVDSTPMNDEFDYYLSRKHWLVAYPDYKETLGKLVDTVKVFFDKPATTGARQEPAEAPAPNEQPEPSVRQEPPRFTPPAPPATPPQQPANDDWLRTKPLTNVTTGQREVIERIIQNMVRVDGGTLMLGATPEQTKADRDEKPPHLVTMSPYYICKYPVTQEEWEVIMGTTPIKKKKDEEYVGPKKPIVNVSLLDCARFAQKLSEMTGINFAIPTEAEWEFAARGGSVSKGYVYSGSNDINEVGWCYSWSSDRLGPHNVGLKKPNELGLYDMSGNVEEWCCEEKGKYTDASVTDPYHIYKPSFLNEGSYVLRGGCYITRASTCRVSYRRCFSDDYKSDDAGFRLVVLSAPRWYKFQNKL